MSDITLVQLLGDGPMLCDESGNVCICFTCGRQLFSPYWSARKTYGLHKGGPLKDHDVRVMRSGEAFVGLEG